MKRIFVLLLLIGLVVASAGCIRKEGPLIIIDLSELNNLTDEISNQTNSTVNNGTQLYTWEDDVLVGKNVIVNGKWLIKPDYDVSKAKFVFWIINLETNKTDLYYEPTNVTLDSIHFYGYGVFAGTNYYVTHIKLESPEPLEVTVK
ncbi:hypothetical protein [Thermococcus barophilus]|uniref:Lipoprotein n=1 Tax=Thermococcus barophilus TaxID=55802 RepID=A0A0S1XEJ6_THEBA|nr:hypothetical protein [Thermococcus barophilus]ALM76217.1 conserved exported hypothetical protein [Thermococcus barophilus]